ncbi:CAP domain-containing protein [Streptomyces sp. NPDC053086]|uniref:CAP domain-containing protein n=1 Tax=unclassified Streptomyces TaxID=2593676 RepID=UPI0037D82039
MGRHRRSAAGRAATGRSTGATHTQSSGSGSEDAQHSSTWQRPLPMGTAPYLNPEAYAEATAKASAYLFATDADAASATPGSGSGSGSGSWGDGSPGGGFTPDGGPSGDRRRRNKTMRPVRAGLLGVSVAVALGTVAVAAGVMPGLDNYRLGGGSHTAGGDRVQSAAAPRNTESAQGGASGSAGGGGRADGRSYGSATSGTRPTASPSPSASASPSKPASPTPAPPKKATEKQAAKKPAPKARPAQPAKPAAPPVPAKPEAEPKPSRPATPSTPPKPSAPATSAPPKASAPATSAPPKPSAPATPAPPTPSASATSADPKPTPSRTATKEPSPASTPVTVPLEATIGAEVLNLVNDERAKAGCSPLAANSALTGLAETFSDDMAARDFFAHTDPEGRTPWDRAAKAGVTGLGGENIARGQADAAAVMTVWMNSAGHRANILNCGFKTLGVGVHFGAGGPWWTQEFGY